MTRKDYILIAQAIRSVDDKLSGCNDATNAVLHIVDNLCVELRRDNPRFDYTRFRRAALHQAE